MVGEDVLFVLILRVDKIGIQVNDLFKERGILAYFCLKILNISIEADDNLPFLRSKVIRSIALMKDSIVKILNRGIVEGQVRKGIDAEEFANFFFVSIEGAVSLSRVEGDLRSFRVVKKFIERQIDEISI